MKTTLHSVMKKIIASVFALVLVITGVCLIQTEGSKVFAATTATPQATVKNMIAAGEAPSAEDGKIFAGWYSDANYGSVIKSADAVPAAGAYAKFVDSDVLGVKLQSQEIGGLTNLRIVTSVDSLNYTNVGFEIAVGEQSFSYDTYSVLNKIDASAESGVVYEYTPNVVDEDSKYFMTLTVTGIPSASLDDEFYIKPYWTTYDGTKVYGISRYVSVNDGNSSTVANLPIKVDTALTENSTVNVTMTHYNLDGNTSQTTAQATVMKMEDNGYAHLNIAVDDKTALNSATVVSLSTGEKAVYRNLDSSYTSNQKKADISWFKAYEAMGETEKFVIATSADLYGFQQLSASSDFSGQNISLCADVTVNPDTWDAKADAVTTPEFSWTPIGKSGMNSSGKVFAGVFDGKGHEISGLYFSTTSEGLGMFGQIAGATIQNVELKNSYFYAACNNGWNTIGSIISTGYGTIRNVYSDASIISNGERNGGIAGIASGGTLNISGCWFAGKIEANGTVQAKTGGILGYVASNGTGVIENCLNSASISTSYSGNAMIGGLVGYLDNTITLSSSLSVGTITTGTSNLYTGSVIGYRNGKSLTIPADAPVYGLSESYTYNSAGHLGAFYYENANAWSNAYTVTKANLTGVISSLNTKLDFYDVDDNKSGVWVAVDGSNPVPKVFADEAQNALTDSSIDWYADGTYVIENLADLRGFAELVKAYNFDGKTVKLNADITLNKEGKATDWETTAPKETWTPIGWTEESATTQTYQKFSGTFDGQGHTLSGFYVKNNTYQTGLFGYVYYATIKDLKFTNSYIESSVSSGHQYANTGSIAACGYVKMSDVYSDAVIVSNGNYVGGLFGRPYHNIASTFTNCWFDGTLKLKGETGIKGGGIVGAVEGAPCELTNCLSSGSLSSEKSTNKAYLGGLIGYYTKAVTLTNCLSTADISTNAVDIYSGSVIGHYSGGSLTYTNVYAMFESCVINGATNIGQIPVASTTVLTEAALTGVLSMANTELDFYDANGNTTGVWMAVNNGTPVLKKFAGDVETVDTTKYSVDWYSADATEYTLYDLADMRGFKELAKASNFSGKKVKLGADITLNNGTAANWGVTPPAEEWEPIGRNGEHEDYPRFAGTFDGQGHTLSGFYVDSDTAYVGLFGNIEGATIKNFKLVNSHFESELATNAYGCVGGIAGIGYGYFEDIYNTAIVSGYSQYAGGFIGLSSGSQSTFTNCWFGGQVYLNGDYGVYAGGIAGGCNANGGCVIAHCQNTGTISYSKTSGSIQVGGMIGRIQAASSITDSLCAGTITTKSGVTEVGSVVGWNGASMTASTTYAMTESHASLGGVTVSSTVSIVQLPKTQLLGKKGYEKTQLDFYVAGTNDDGYWLAIDGGIPELKKFANVNNAADLTGALRPDFSWYSESATTHYINSTEQFLGFMEVARTDSFSGETIYLNTDVVLNTGTASTWATTAPEYVYDPIGWRDGSAYSGYAKFAGTLDGQGHSISGLYIKTDIGGVGLFGNVAGATVRKLKLLNSYIESNQSSASGWGMIGSIAGMGYGTFETIYSDAIVICHSQYAGGLLGKLSGATQVTNCWFDGSLQLKGNAVRGGGLVGEVSDNSTCSIIYSLNSAPVSAEYATANAAVALGGLVGRSKTTLDIQNSLSTGTVTAVAGTLCAGSILGQNSGAESAFTASTTYAMTESNTSLGGYTKTETNAITQISKTDLLGDLAKDSAVALNYTVYWECAYNSTPILQSFGANAAIDAVAGTDATADSRGDGNYMVTVTGDTGKTTYNSYVSSLTNNGYTLHVDNSAATELANYVKTATYTKDGMAMTVTHMEKTGKTYLTACKDLPLSKHLKYDTSYLTGNVSGKKTTLANLAMYTDYGTSMIIQLKNGHFIVYDGGMSGTDCKDMTYLIQHLKNYASKPVVEAWIFSHLHSDHAGVMQHVAWDLVDYSGICVEGIYYNEPSNDSFAMETGENSPVVMKQYVEVAAQKFTTTSGGHPETYRLQTGQRYYFNDITMDVVFAQDQLPKSEYVAVDGPTDDSYDNFNETSTWLTFTIDGQKVLTNGDTDQGSMDWVINNYAGGYLKNLTMVTLPHHGYNPYQGFTDAVEAQSVIVNNDGYSTTSKYKPNVNLKNKVDEWVTWSGTGGIIYSFPYTVGSYSKIPASDMP